MSASSCFAEFIKTSGIDNSMGDANHLPLNFIDSEGLASRFEEYLINQLPFRYVRRYSGRVFHKTYENVSKQVVAMTACGREVVAQSINTKIPNGFKLCKQCSKT